MSNCSIGSFEERGWIQNVTKGFSNLVNYIAAILLKWVKYFWLKVYLKKTCFRCLEVYLLPVFFLNFHIRLVPNEETESTHLSRGMKRRSHLRSEVYLKAMYCKRSVKAIRIDIPISIFHQWKKHAGSLSSHSFPIFQLIPSPTIWRDDVCEREKEKCKHRPLISRSDEGGKERWLSNEDWI